MSALLTAADVSRMQHTMLQSLPDSCNVLRPTKTPDAGGGQTTTRATLGPYPCRLDPYFGRRGGVETDIQGWFETSGYWHLTIPAATDVTAKDQVVVGARTFEVRAVEAPDTWEVGRVLVLVEML